MSRTPNVECAVCKIPIYKRPHQIISKGYVTYCRQCSNKKREIKKKSCECCNQNFVPAKPHIKYCSKKCSNIARVGKGYAKSGESSSARKLGLLKQTFNFKHCMIEGCTYNKTYDVHRHISGKNGGKYELDNMFAICPNHHAEVSRKLIELEKINNYTLKIILK